VYPDSGCCWSREGFRKVDAPHLASEVHRGGVFEDGVQVTKQNQRAAA
jgi:hypothetical protein